MSKTHCLTHNVDFAPGAMCPKCVRVDDSFIANITAQQSPWSQTLPQGFVNMARELEARRAAETPTPPRYHNVNEPAREGDVVLGLGHHYQIVEKITHDRLETIGGDGNGFEGVLPNTLSLVQRGPTKLNYKQVHDLMRRYIAIRYRSTDVDVKEETVTAMITALREAGVEVTG